MSGGNDLVTLNDLYEKLKCDIKCSEAEISKKIENLNAVLSQANQKISKLEQINNQLSEKVKDLTRDSKKNNILIFGVEESEGEDIYDTVTALFIDILKVPINKSEINQAYRFGNGAMNARPIVVKFVNFHKKLDILKNGYALKGTPITVSSDLIKEDREKQKILLKHQKQARSQQLVAKIRNNKLHINDTIYTVEDLIKLEKEADENFQTVEKETVQNENSNQTQSQVKTPKTVHHTFRNTKNVQKPKQQHVDNTPSKEGYTSPKKTANSTKGGRGINYGLRSAGSNVRTNQGASTSGKQKNK